MKVFNLLRPLLSRGLHGGVLVSACLATACSSTSYVMLLDNPDGSTGKVTVTGGKGVTVLEKAKMGAILDGSSKEPFAVNEDRIKADFGATIAATPKLPITFVLNFETGGARLTSDSEKKMPGILEEIGTRPGADISIIGHTDTVGAAETNEKVGQTRAKFVEGLIAEKNHDVKITVTSHGKTNLLVPTADSVDEPRNRRVEVTVR